MQQNLIMVALVAGCVVGGTIFGQPASLLSGPGGPKLHLTCEGRVSGRLVVAGISGDRDPAGNVSVTTPREHWAAVAEQYGVSRTVGWCADLPTGAVTVERPEDAAFTALASGSYLQRVLDGESPDYWIRVWAVRGLLYVWDDVAATGLPQSLSLSWRKCGGLVTTNGTSRGSVPVHLPTASSAAACGSPRARRPIPPY